MWKIKVFIQFILSHVLFGEQLNHLLQRVHRNSGKRTDYISNQIPGLCRSLEMLRKNINLDKALVVEVGTGWCPVPTILLALSGAVIYTYDHIRHVRFDLIHEMLIVLEKNTAMIAVALDVSEVDVRNRLAEFLGTSSLEQLCECANIHYMAPGDASNSGLSGASVDLFYSYAVLEHVPENVLLALVKEARRVLRESGCFYALIGLHDHYASFDNSVSKVNFLKYPEWLWSFFVKNNISYHNRLRECDYIKILKDHGAKIKEITNDIDPKDVAMCRVMKLDKRFRHLTAEECAVTKTEIIAMFERET